MKKVIKCTLALAAMFAVSFNANAEDNSVKENEEKVEINVSEESTATKNNAEEIDEVAIYQRADGSVIIASSLSPTHTIILSKRRISGLALTEGGISSHVVILARNYGIPTLVGVHEGSIKRKIKNGQTVIIDTDSAEILADPDNDTIDE